MDAVREQMNKPVVAGIAGLVIGLIIGWFVIGWGLWPVQWTDASPQQLRDDLKVDYMRMAIDSYAQNQDANQAQTRFQELGPDASQVLADVAANPGTQNPAAILAFQAVVQAGTAPLGTPGAATATPAAAGSSFLRILLPVICVIFLLLAAALIAFFFLRSRQGGVKSVTPAMQAQQAARQAEWTDYESTGEEPPMVQFMASYKLGDDLFDDSFSIDSPSGEFLGECGVGISETIGVGDPKKVSAFEVWLFDKNDIQTVTKVLMSAHAFLDEATRQRLSAKGEPILVESGTETVLETQSLRLVARAVDMGYGEGALPNQSFFDRLILELAVWQKA
jgi:hypothetical protein